jgi:tetratricopeptide (TPR) repeat protein
MIDRGNRERVRHRIRGPLGTLAVLAAVWTWSDVPVAFSNLAVGDPVENVQLPTLDGGTLPLLGSDAEVHVFGFFRVGQPNSLDALRELARVEAELREKSIHWVIIVSGRYEERKVHELVAEAGLELPVALDRGDALYGHFGVILHPVVGIVGGGHTLRAYEPFSRINYGVRIKARIRHALGELSDGELTVALDPPPTRQGDDSAVARRNLHLAEKLHAAGKAEKALARLGICIELDPTLAAAHALIGAILEEQGDCPGALDSYERALSLDSGDPLAREGRARCAQPTDSEDEP